METVKEVIRRKATEEELVGANPWLRWAYDRGLDLVYWRWSKTVTLYRPHVEYEPDQAVILNKDAD